VTRETIVLSLEVIASLFDYWISLGVVDKLQHGQANRDEEQGQDKI
jgi:hypothetical protein